MDGTGSVPAAAAAFVGTHFLLSHPLRKPLVAIAGERGFQGIYSLVAVVTLAWLVFAYRAAPASAPLWPVGNTLWAVVTAAMLLASFLLAGSMLGNPAFPGQDPNGPRPAEARGVYAITRHPMMWSFALWGACHIAVYPIGKNVVVAIAIIILSLVGAAMQDRKKQELQPALWGAWKAKTSYWPLAAVASGRSRLDGLGLPALGGGLVIWLAATWVHMPISGWAAGIWRWVL